MERHEIVIGGNRVGFISHLSTATCLITISRVIWNVVIFATIAAVVMNASRRCSALDIASLNQGISHALLPLKKEKTGLSLFSGWCRCVQVTVYPV